MISPELKDIPLASIRPSGTNPRKDFESASVKAYLVELAETIRRPQGVLQPALVRPAYCVGTRSHAKIEDRKKIQSDGMFVLVAGECRWRASQLANRPTLPCVVREMTDDDAREAQQIENLQRRDLSPLEEAQGYEEMLALRNDDGTPRYTIASLAERIGRGVDYVYKRRALLNLPEIAKTALSEGKLTPNVARLILQVPGTEARERFALKVLKPDVALGPLSYVEARRVRDDLFAVSLKGSPFKLDDAALLPKAGACAACPKMAGNMAHLFEADETAAWKSHTCLDPVCHRAKLAALFARQGEAAKAEGKKLLPPEENEKVYPALLVQGMMAPTSPFVELSRKPEPHLLKKEVGLAVGVTWGRLIEEAERKTGVKVPRIVGRDQGHVLHDLVDARQAMALIEKSGEPIFRGSEAGGGAIADKAKLDRKAEKEAAKAQHAATLAGIEALHAELVKPEPAWDWDEVWSVALDAALLHAGPVGVALLGEWAGKPADEVKRWLYSLPPRERRAFIPLLLIAPSLHVNGVRCELFKALAEKLGVDVKAIEKKARGATKAARSKPAKLTGAALEARVRELRREGQGETTIYLNLQCPRRTLKSILKKIAAEEAEAKSA